MLELRPGCECCDKDLPPDSADARICTFECTFCATCADDVLKGRCPNCGGDRAPAAGEPACEVPGVHRTHPAGRLRERLTAPHCPPSRHDISIRARVTASSAAIARRAPSSRARGSRR